MRVLSTDFRTEVERQFSRARSLNKSYTQIANKSTQRNLANSMLKYLQAKTINIIYVREFKNLHIVHVFCVWL